LLPDPQQEEQRAGQHYAVEEEQRRRRGAIEVPGLSAKARGALRALADAGANPGWTPPELSERSNPAPETILATARCARLQEAILADSPLRAELNRFEAAVASRLAHGGQVGTAGSLQRPGAEHQAEWSYGVLVAARASHAWYPVLQDYVAAHPGLQVRVEHAEFMLRLTARRTHRGPANAPEPKPSPGRSFGPGM
jgi:hypothetical protein